MGGRYSVNTRGCSPVHAHYGNLPNFVCLQGKPRFQMSLNCKSIPFYLFLMLGMNVSFELSDYWDFSLVHAACKLQSVVVRITASLSY